MPDDETRFRVAGENLQDLSAAEVLAFFRRERSRLVGLLEGLGPRDWPRTGVHPREGERTLLQLADLHGHHREHFAQAGAAIADATR